MIGEKNRERVFWYSLKGHHDFDKALYILPGYVLVRFQAGELLYTSLKRQFETIPILNLDEKIFSFLRSNLGLRLV